MTNKNDTELDLLKNSTFDWTQNLQSVWLDDPFDLSKMHLPAKHQFKNKIEQLLATEPATSSPLGWPLIGAGGVGKTHLLGSFRKLAEEAGCAFIMIDMTDVRDFWETVLAGFTTSLEQVYIKKEPQRYFVIAGLVNHFSSDPELQSKLKAGLNGNHKAGFDDVKKHLNQVLSVLDKWYRIETSKYQDVIRSVIVADCEDYEIASIGQNWLQGLALDEEDQRAIGLSTGQQRPSAIVAAISWLISLGSPAIIAFDQIDPIIRQLEFQVQQTGIDPELTHEIEANRIISSLADGFSGMFDLTKRSLCVLSCLENSYDSMKVRGLATALDRYESPTRLQLIESPDLAISLISTRVSAAAKNLDRSIPYPGWPVVEPELTSLIGHTPREILKRCGEHRKNCLLAGRFELLQFTVKSTKPREPSNQPLDAIDQLYEQFQQEAVLSKLLDESSEDSLLAAGSIAVCSTLVREQQLPVNISAFVDTVFTGGSKTKPLHARIRLIFHDEEEREEHFSIRVIQRQNARAFQNRLQLAMTQSGIDEALSFRHLAIVRTNEIPRGQVTGAMAQQFRTAGGVLVDPSDAELMQIDALRRLIERDDPGLDAWLANRQPASGLVFCQRAFADMFDRLTLRSQPNGRPEPTIPTTPTPTPTPTSSSHTFPLGRSLVGTELTMPIELLEKHTVVLAGAGSGKTVLLKRIIETAALRSIPSIVIDGANDLAALADVWPSPPQGWQIGDAELADEYQQKVETIIWTPGRQSGNPMGLDLVPDLTHTLADNDEFESAIAMISGAIAALLKLGSGKSDQNKIGILSKSLRYYAHQAGTGLPGYIETLASLPAEARLGISRESKLAGEIADGLRVLAETDPLIGKANEILDPAVLFGDDRQRESTRVSVVNLDSLGTLERQQQFINQLSTTLFTWIKRYPTPPDGRALRGLLVIDEAKDFIPARKSTACKDSLMRLTAQARKYHLGVIFATQNPREIENTVIGNCSTHFYGKASSPAAIETIQSLVRDRGGDAPDIARLGKGEFYIYNAESITAPEKTTSPLCLTHHRTMESSDVAELARRSRIELSKS